MNRENLDAIPLWLSIPFVVMLLFIAVGPLLFNHWWENNRNKLKVSLALGVPLSVVLVLRGLQHELIHQILFDYIPFIILLGALFVITGGIQLKGDIEAKPSTNTVFLAIGAILASFMGTTGAAMLLIRPIIRTNELRTFKVHTILFFIAIVANAGGMLTPLGDPPLFLLYLRGTPFIWFLGLFGPWIFVNGLLLGIFYMLDKFYYKQEPVAINKKETSGNNHIQISGNLNFIFLAGVVLSVAFLNGQFIPAIHHNHYLGFIREGVILFLAVLSLATSSKEIRYRYNHFSWGPITEVAFLFIGIFITMVPALLYLKENARSFGLDSPALFYSATGGLSAFLDNAPTAVSFHNMALGMSSQFGSAKLVAGIPEIFLKAISLGAVFFGAMTYIGNGPNFMVKAIAEENNISMPGFFGYIFKFSIIILLPVYILTELIFL
ncbi:MAG TPA: sodium:proton antiporter [Mariniphaga anaerophila]|uniref:Sodium:proton antiporter n=1 Tax=Mariniphaga anaerophila TaxID=1484053 RepID=A0A831PI05_9BACT|nr:sodium:proton antiporter [Mariniphaga anaerophila]